MSEQKCETHPRPTEASATPGILYSNIYSTDTQIHIEDGEPPCWVQADGGGAPWSKSRTGLAGGHALGSHSPLGCSVMRAREWAAGSETGSTQMW